MVLRALAGTIKARALLFVLVADKLAGVACFLVLSLLTLFPSIRYFCADAVPMDEDEQEVGAWDKRTLITRVVQSHRFRRVVPNYMCKLQF